MKAKIFHKLTVTTNLALVLLYLTLVLDQMCLHITCFVLKKYLLATEAAQTEKIYHLSQIFKHTLLYNSRRYSHPKNTRSNDEESDAKRLGKFHSTELE